MTPLFIGRYFISCSVSGKSFSPETVDTMIFIYSVHVTRGRPRDPSPEHQKHLCLCYNCRRLLFFYPLDLVVPFVCVFVCVRACARVGAAPTGDGLL